MLSTCRDVLRIDSQVMADIYTFETVKEIIYLGSAVTTKNDVSLEIERRITLSNRCYYGLNKQLSNRDLSRTIKLILYKMLILHVLLYGAEAWTLLRTDASALRIFERKVLSKTFGSVRVADDFRTDIIVSCISHSTTWTLCSVLIPATALARPCHSYGRGRSGETGIYVGRTKSRKPCHRLVWPTRVGAREAEPPGRMY